MLRLTKRRRALVAGKILDVANLVLAAIGIGSLVREPGVSSLTLAAAVCIWLTAIAGAILMEPADD